MYGNRKVVHIVAVGANMEIGKDGKLLWNIKKDLEFFKNQTLGHALIMGRKTYDSLPKKLSRRVTYRISRDVNEDNSCTLEEGLAFASNMAKNLLMTDTIIVAGGAEIYKATENIVDEILLTQVNLKFPEADTFYRIPEGFTVSDEHVADAFIDEKYGFITFKKLVKTY